MKHNRRAFTLTEILIVIGLIVLMLGLATAAFNIIGGGRSVEGAINNLSAVLGRARAEAIGIQQPTGVMFYTDPATHRVAVAIVRQTDAAPTSAGGPKVDVWLDLAGDDVFMLPAGVTLQTMCQPSYNGLARASDGYLGYNVQCVDTSGQPDNVSVPVGGVILFDGTGKVVHSRYGFRCSTAQVGVRTAMGDLLNPAKPNSDVVTGSTANLSLLSSFGVALFERAIFTEQGNTEDDTNVNPSRSYTSSPSGPTESQEELWIDQNGAILLINRYTGTLNRAT